MPTALEILNKKNHLNAKADKYYRAIEEWHRYDDNGNVVHSPMNVSSQFRGSSSRPHQINSYNLACTYFEFREKNLDSEAIEKTVNFFCKPIYSDQEYWLLPSEEQSKLPGKAILIPHRFMEAFQDFKQHLEELKDILNQYKIQTTDVEIAVRELFRQSTNYLVETYSVIDPRHDLLNIVKTACEKAVIKVSNISENTFAMDLNDLFKLKQAFIRAISSTGYTYNLETQEMLPIRLPAAADLEKFFITLVPNVGLIQAFNTLFAAHEHYFQSSIIDAHAQSENRWGTIKFARFWSQEQFAHHHQFKNVLTDINNPKKGLA